MTLLDDPQVGQLRHVESTAVTDSPNRRLPGWRFAARLARREVRRRPGRTALVAALVAIPILAMTVGLGVVQTASDTPQERFEQQYGRADVSAYIFDLSRDAVVRRVPAGSHVAFTRQLNTSITTPGGRVISYVDFRIIPFDDPITDGIVQVDRGRFPSGPAEVLLEHDIAGALGVGVGDTFELARPSGQWTVVGIGRTNSNLDSPLFAVSEFDDDRVDDDDAGDVALIDLPADFTADDLQAISLTETEGANTDVAPAFAASIGWDLTGGDEDPVAALAWGWVAGAIALAAVGVIIAAAFASSARRQLTTIGLLSANGASEHLVRRTLALQGAWTGLIGATIGVAAGLVATPLTRDVTERAVNHQIGAWTFDPAALLVILGTGVLAATIAAMVPARSASRIPVLSALAGRRPLATVPRRLVPIGLTSFAGGVALLVLVTLASSEGQISTNGNVYAAAAVLGGLAVIAGMCCASPIAVDLIGRAGSRLGGTWRLAARSLSRSRTRSAGVLTAIAVTGTAAIAITTAVGSLAFGDERSVPFVPRDTVVLTSLRFDETPAAPNSDVYLSTVTAAPLDADTLEQLDVILPGATTVERFAAIPTGRIDRATSRSAFFLVADAATLDMLGLSERDRDALETTGFLDTSDFEAGSPGERPTYTDTVSTPSGPVSIEVPFAEDALRSRAGYWGAVITPERAEELGLHVVDYGVVAISPDDLTSDQRSALDQLRNGLWNVPGDAFIEPDDVPIRPVDDTDFVGLDMQLDYESTAITFPRALVDAIALAVALVLTLLVVAIGLSLAATESRDERDVLVAIGAKPRTLRVLAGSKAIVLTVGAAFLAIPTGFIPVAAVLAAADDGNRIAFPWLTALGLLVLVPALAGLAALTASAIAQRARPMTMSTLATD
ncbi:MAG: FtsX-like permease family protein [Ilumatobacteraceae bacterium]